MTPDLANWTLEQFTAFALMLVRVSVLFISAPVLGNARIPNQLQIGITMMITLVLYLSLKGGHMAHPVPANVFSPGQRRGGGGLCGPF